MLLHTIDQTLSNNKLRKTMVESFIKIHLNVYTLEVDDGI